MSQSRSAAAPDFAAFVAIDWADRKHAWALQAAGSTEREYGTLEHTPEAIEEWAMQLAARFEGRAVAVALEQSRGALFHALRKYRHVVLYAVHPSSSHDYRKAMYPSGSKDDPCDADLLLDLLTLHRNRLRALEPETEAVRRLQALVEQRRQLVDARTAQTNRVTHQLKLYFPQMLDWFDDLSAPMVAAFLERWPTLAEVQKEQPEALRAFFRQHGSRSATRIEARLRRIEQAKPLTTDAAVIEPGVIVVQTLLATVADLNRGIRELEKAIETAAASDPDYAIFASFPGAGPAMAPRLLAAFGSRRERYRSAAELQSFSGIAPVMQASGRQRLIRCRWACPKFLRQTFHEYAACSRRRSAWARAFYEKQKARGKTHQAAVRSLAFKWIRILFRCWQSRQPYREELYVAASEGRAVPLSRRASGAAAERVTAPAHGSPACGKVQQTELKKAGEILKSLMAEA